MTSLVTGAQVNIYAKDPEVLAAFYAALGLTERFRFPQNGTPDQVEVSAGAFTLGLTSRSALLRLAGLQVEPGTPQSEVVLWCEDASSLFLLATASGARPVAAPKLFNNRLLAAWVEDPEGNRVKIVSLLNPLPPSSGA